MWWGKQKRLRHILVVYIRPDSSRVCRVPLSFFLPHPRPIFLGLLFRFLYNAPYIYLSLPVSIRPRRVYIFKTRYSFRSLRVAAFTFLPLEYPLTASRDVGENRRRLLCSCSCSCRTATTRGYSSSHRSIIFVSLRLELSSTSSPRCFKLVALSVFFDHGTLKINLALFC